MHDAVASEPFQEEEGEIPGGEEVPPPPPPMSLSTGGPTPRQAPSGISKSTASLPQQPLAAGHTGHDMEAASRGHRARPRRQSLDRTVTHPEFYEVGRKFEQAGDWAVGRAQYNASELAEHLHIPRAEAMLLCDQLRESALDRSKRQPPQPLPRPNEINRIVQPSLSAVVKMKSKLRQARERVRMRGSQAADWQMPVQVPSFALARQASTDVAGAKELVRKPNRLLRLLGAPIKSMGATGQRRQAQYSESPTQERGDWAPRLDLHGQLQFQDAEVQGRAETRKVVSLIKSAKDQTAKEAKQAAFIKVRARTERFVDLTDEQKRERIRVLSRLVSFMVAPDTDTSPPTWSLTTPSVILDFTGTAQGIFAPRPILKERFSNALLGVAESTNAWLVTGGTNTGVMALVGEAIAERKQVKTPAIGIATAGGTPRVYQILLSNVSCMYS